MKSKAFEYIIFVLAPSKTLRNIYFAIFSLLIISCSKDSEEKTVVVPEITFNYFFERVQSKYQFTLNDRKLIINFNLNDLSLSIQENKYSKINCWQTEIINLREDFRLLQNNGEGYSFKTDWIENYKKKGVIEYSLFFEKNNLYLTKKNIYTDPDLDEIESTSTGFKFDSIEIESCPEDVDYRIDPNYEDLDLLDPNDYATAFFRDASDLNVEIDYKEMIISIISDDVWERGSAIGVAKRVCNDDIIIELKEGYWNQESVMRRFDLMYHELGHDALNLKHVCNRYDIMYTSNTEFNESCRENLNLVVTDSLDPQKYYGFKKASSRMFLGVNQVNFDCGADKTRYNVIVD
tara:strand:+ start:60 stop:1106 length:1047 start_codon:yes stop_codon:yes gene_type:complete